MTSPPAGSLRKQIEDFVDYCMESDKSLETVASYRQVLTAFGEWLEKAHPQVGTVSDISRSHLQGFRRHLRTTSAAAGREIAPSTLGKYFTVIRSWFRYARQEANLPVLSPDEVAMPKRKAESRRSELASVDAETLLGQPDVTKIWGLRDRAMIAVLLTSGLKLSQVCALDRKDLKEEILAKTESLVLRKSPRRPEVTLDASTQRYLKDYLDLRTDEYRALFVRHKPGKNIEYDDSHHRLTRQMVHRMLERYSRTAGIPYDVSPVMLRRAQPIR